MPCFLAYWIKQQCRDGVHTVSTLLLLLWFATPLFAQNADSVQQRQLNEVIIATEQPVRIAADAAVVQQLTPKHTLTASQCGHLT